MVDETTELVGVETKEGKAYRRKYLWPFFAKHIKMVYYHYNNGSRSSDAAKSFLEYFMGTISTDGYTAVSYTHLTTSVWSCSHKYTFSR